MEGAEATGPAQLLPGTPREVAQSVPARPTTDAAGGPIMRRHEDAERMTFLIRVETLESPLRYTPEQIEQAARIAERLGRGRLVLCEKPGQ